MNLNINKSYGKFSVDVDEYSEDPHITVNFLTTDGVDMDPFDFINIVFYGKNYTESASITVGKDALKKFVELMEKAVRSYREKNSSFSLN